MDGLLKILAAFVAALNAATGAPVDVNSMPDRPPITFPTLAPLPTLPSSSALPTNDVAVREAISGRITNLQEGFVFVNEIPILLEPATKVNGQLRVGLAVQVQATLRADGALEAMELDLSDMSDGSPSMAQPAQQTSKNAADDPVATPLIREARPVSPATRPTNFEAPAREKPEVARTEQPTAQQSGFIKDEPTVVPTPQVTPKPSNDDGKPVQNGTPSQASGKTSDSGTTQDSTGDGGGTESPGE